MTFLRARIAAALPLVIADWRTHSSAVPSVRAAFQSVNDLTVLGFMLGEFDRRTLDDEETFHAEESDLRNAYDLVTDPANRELVDFVAADLYAEG